MNDEKDIAENKEGDKTEEEYLSEDGNEIIEPEEEILDEENAKQKIKKLKERLNLCEKEKKEYLSGWQKERADSINVKKSEEKTREYIINFKKEEILKDFLDISDSFEQAFKNDGFKDMEENYKKGVEAIHGRLAQILERHKVMPYESKGEIFNPEKHEALTTEYIDESENDNIILEEFQKGYSVNDKVLRHAKVKVGIYKENNK